MKPCDGLDKHLSALVDGELTALETIAVRTHLTQCERCRSEVRSLETLKLTIHRAGKQVILPAQTKQAWRCLLNTQYRSSTPYWRYALGGTIAAILSVFVLSTSASSVFPMSWPEVSPAPQEARVMTPSSSLDFEFLAALVRAHRDGFETLRHRPAGLLAIEQVPAHLLGQQRPSRLVRASYSACEDSTGLATLAVLDARALRLDDAIEDRLARGGVYIDVLDGVDVRVSLRGGKVFVVLTNTEPAPAI